MRISDYWLGRQIAGCLVMLLVAPFGKAATTGLQQATPNQQAAGARDPQNSAASKPAVDTPRAASGDLNSSSSQPSAPSPQASAPASAPDQQQQNSTKPVGTAAAPYERTTGVPAARPAGAAIAPAKQRRTRSFLIRVGVIVGAAVAVGTVVGLSKASPSRP